MERTLSHSDARRLVLHLQGLSRPPGRAFARRSAADAQGADTLAATIDRLGFVQVDSIPHVERAHHMILHARGQSYRPRDLARLHERGGLFEAWTHDASYVPARLWPLWKHRFRRSKDRLRAQFLRWQGATCLDQVDRLLGRIRDDGPIMSRDLERPGTSSRAEMWQWSDGKAALEYLWRTGELGIARRDGFQKVYDLAERCVPREHFEAEISEADFIDRSCRMALEGLGWATPNQLARYLDHVDIAEAKEWLAAQAEDVVAPVAVDGRAHAARADLMEVVEAMPASPPRIRALSPFDPVVRDRQRLAWLWGFDYRIEIYVPAHKRRWGYYVFPLLEGERMIGRIDMRAVRPGRGAENDDTIEVRRLWLQPGVRWSAGRRARLEAELTRLARLAGVSAVRWLETEPATSPGPPAR